jgi:hypothetical protein
MKAIMKPNTYLIGILTALAAFAARAQSPSFLTNGLVSYYPFNGNANDASGNANNGVLQGGVGFGVDRYGNTNSALFFTNGADGQMTTTIQQPAGDVFTLTEWFNLPPSFSSGSPLICLTDTQTGGYDRFDKALQIGGGSNQLVFYLFPGTAVELTTPNPVTDGRWHQAVATLSTAGMQLYLDGELAAANASVTTSQEFAGYWRIAPGQGSVDDIRVYNRALSLIEVQQLYAYEGPPCLPHSATATPTVVDGFVVAATITDGGCGYTNAPLVVVQGGGGSGATASAVVSNGIVTGIKITDAGIGYTSSPSIYIYSPLGWQMGIVKAVVPTFTGLLIGTNYQLQSSTDLNIWVDQGPPFTATSPVMDYPQYFDVEDWSRLFFRLEVAP